MSNMSSNTKSRSESISNVLLRVPILTYAIITVSLPAVALFVCFITAFLFRFDDVNDTQCNVTNFIPSISAVTGITPQTYIWRICIALHSAPRFAIAIVYFNYYKNLQHLISPKYVKLFSILTHVNFWFNTIENSSLVGVTYISNRENYPVHEKIFIVFMVLSLCYMLLNTILFRWTRSGTMTADEKMSFKWKVIMFVANFASTMGLLYFFVLHRFYCRPLAFSGFSFCEYVIGYTNMAYHFTAYLEFKTITFTAGTVEPSYTNGTVSNNNKKKE